MIFSDLGIIGILGPVDDLLRPEHLDGQAAPYQTRPSECGETALLSMARCRRTGRMERHPEDR